MRKFISWKTIDNGFRLAVFDDSPRGKTIRLKINREIRQLFD
jgi:hypothetical protein